MESFPPPQVVSESDEHENLPLHSAFSEVNRSQDSQAEEEKDQVDTARPLHDQELVIEILDV